MKILILFFLLLLMPVRCIFAQTDRELLLKISEQQAVQGVKIEALQKQIDVRFEAIDKRFDAVDKRIADVGASVTTLSNSITAIWQAMIAIVIGILTLVLGIFGLVLWDRRIVFKPFEAKATTLKAEIDTLKETFAKKISDIEARLSSSNP